MAGVLHRPGKTLNSVHHNTYSNPVRWIYFLFCLFALTPQPAEYGAEEFSLDAVPTLGLVRD